jgi:elongator complex protein 3
MLFSDARFRPDGLKIYPTMVVEGTELEEWYRQGRYQPYSHETMISLVADIKAIVPGYVRISRVLRDIPPDFIVGGPKDSLRNVVQERLKQQGRECQCIRCREYGHRVMNGWEAGEPRLVRMDYEAAGGREIFLSFEDERGTLFGLLRMRIQTGFNGTAREPSLRGHIPLHAGQGQNGLLRLPTSSEWSRNDRADIFEQSEALIRELHIYGPEVPLKQQDRAAAQHKGLGKALLAEAERIAREEFHAPEMAVLSGVGARDYYRAEGGYRLRGYYMVKGLA